MPKNIYLEYIKNDVKYKTVNIGKRMEHFNFLIYFFNR